METLSSYDGMIACGLILALALYALARGISYVCDQKRFEAMRNDCQDKFYGR